MNVVCFLMIVEWTIDGYESSHDDGKKTYKNEKKGKIEFYNLNFCKKLRAQLFRKCLVI